MTTKLFRSALLSLPLIAAQATVTAYAATDLKTEKDKISYMIGHQIGTNFKREGIEVDFDKLQAGLKDGTAGTKSQLTPEESQALMMNLQKSLQAKAEAKRKEESEKNTAAGKKYRDDFAKQAGVKTTASGLMYKVQTEGKGNSPKATDVVKVNYKGTLTDGTEFDSSYSRGQPATFAVNGVIKGWTEVLQLMKPGAKYTVVIPPELAYGDRGAGDKIGPNSTLAFDVELLDIEKPQAKNEPAKPAASAKPAPKK